MRFLKAGARGWGWVQVVNLGGDPRKQEEGLGRRRGPGEMNAFCGMVLGELVTSVMADVYYGLMLYVYFSR